jgi:glutamate/aspartate transport system permease protein
LVGRFGLGFYSRHRSHLAATGLVAFRNIPLLVQIFLWFFVVPELLPKAWGDWIKQLPPFWTVVVALSFFTSARIAEQVRSGINAQPKGQLMAARALGLTLTQSYRHVLLPMAMRLILPPLTSELLNLMKNTALGFTVGVLEIMSKARSMQEFSFKVFEAFSIATVFYLVINLLIVVGMGYLERRLAVPGYTLKRT